MFKKLIIIVIVILLANLSGCLNNNGNNVDYSKGDLRLTISSDKSSYELNDSIKVSVVLENIGNTTVKVQPIFNSVNFHLNITNSTGYSARGIYPLDPRKFIYDDLLKLVPKENISIEINLIDYYFISSNITETYKIIGRYHPSERGLKEDAKNSWTGHLYSDEIVIEVLE